MARRVVEITPAPSHTVSVRQTQSGDVLVSSTDAKTANRMNGWKCVKCGAMGLARVMFTISVWELARRAEGKPGRKEIEKSCYCRSCSRKTKRLRTFKIDTTIAMIENPKPNLARHFTECEPIEEDVFAGNKWAAIRNITRR